MNPHLRKEIAEGAKVVAQLRKAATKGNVPLIGLPVNVLKDDGSIIQTTIRSEPWQLGHGSWVIMVEGIAGGYDITRITPTITV